MEFRSFVRVGIPGALGTSPSFYKKDILYFMGRSKDFLEEQFEYPPILSFTKKGFIIDMLYLV